MNYPRSCDKYKCPYCQEYDFKRTDLKFHFTICPKHPNRSQSRSDYKLQEDNSMMSNTLPKFTTSMINPPGIPSKTMPSQTPVITSSKHSLIESNEPQPVQKPKHKPYLTLKGQSKISKEFGIHNHSGSLNCFLNVCL